MKKILVSALLVFALTSCVKQQVQQTQQQEIETPTRQKLVAILNTVDDEKLQMKISDLNHLTDRLREIANQTLPKNYFAVMTAQSILSLFPTPEDAIKICDELDGCLVKIGREIAADYIAQVRIGRFGENYTINAELYDSEKGILVSSFTDNSKDIYGLLAAIEEKAPPFFRGISSHATQTHFTPQKQNVAIDGELTDSRDGKKYKAVKIGSQTWMSQNLNYHGADGFLGLCYGDEPKNKIRYPENCEKYGRLYSLEEAKNACPKGWNLPSDNEWKKLIYFAGGDSIAGKKLKAKGKWGEQELNCKRMEIDERGREIEIDECFTDEFGFSALPGERIGQTAWWSMGTSDVDRIATATSENVPIKKGGAWLHKLAFGLTNVNSGGLYYVRCVKN